MVNPSRKETNRAQDLEALSEKYGESSDDIAEAKRNHGRKWRSYLRAARRKDFRARNEGGKHQDQDILKASVLATGSVQQRHVTCGRAKCQCMTHGKKHGPYWYLSMPVPARRSSDGNPTMVHFYLTQAEAAFYAERIRRFRELQDQVWDALWSELSQA
jgi:hypothetical protein